MRIVRGRPRGGSDRRGDVGFAKRPQRQNAAARTQRRQHPRRGMTDQQQQGALRRLLQHFEQRIGAGAVQLVDGIDDGDAPAALACRRAEKRHRAADVFDGDLLMQHALVVERALDDEKIGLRLGGDAPRHRIFGVDFERRRSRDRARRRIGMREHEPRHAVGKRRFADALRPRDQKGMRHAAGAIGGQQRRFGERVAEQRAGRARMRRGAIRFVVFGFAHAPHLTRPRLQRRAGRPAA